MTGKTAHFQREGLGGISRRTAGQYAKPLITQQILLEATFRHRKEEKETGNSLHGFTKGKVCLTSLIASEMVALILVRIFLSLPTT